MQKNQQAEIAYQNYHKLLKSYFRRHRVNENDVDDLLHDVFIKLMRATRNDEVLFSKPYLYTTAYTVMVDHFNKQKNTHNHHVHIENAGFEEVVMQASNTAENSAEEQYFGEVLLKSIKQCFAKLSPVQQEVFYLCRLDNYSLREVSERRGVSVSSTERSLYKGIKTLKASLMEVA